MREGLLGFAVVVSRARRLLDAAVDLYAFAGRGDEVTDALIDAAEARALVAATATDADTDAE